MVNINIVAFLKLTPCKFVHSKECFGKIFASISIHVEAAFS